MVGLQETIKKDFSARDLDRLTPKEGFSWQWTPARGHSGGILLGIKEDILQIENWETDDFYVGATIRHRLLNIRWDFITVYGPADHARSPDFLESLTRRCENATLPLLMGGDFNLVRCKEDKSLGVCDPGLMDLFNNLLRNLLLERFIDGVVDILGPTTRVN